MKHFNPIMSLLFAMQLAATSFAAPALDPEGMAILPYSEDFSDEQSVEYLDIVDANNDGRTWYYSDIVFDIRNRASEEVDADDWLMLPPMRMERSKSYRLTFKARAVYPMYTERLEVCLGAGKEADPDAMKTVLIPARDVIDSENLGVTVTVPEDGIYRIGFHAISAKGAFRLAVDDILVDSPMSGYRPGSAANCKAEIITAGELTARVSFTAPDKTVNGDQLSEIDKIVIYVNGEAAHEINPAVPGQDYSAEIPTQQGVNSIEVVAVNSEGAGEPASCSLFTGDDVPLPPTNVKMEVRDGKAYLTWEAPRQGENGGFIDPSTLTYEIQRRSDFQFVEEAFSGTEYVDVLPDNINSRPRQLFYCVRAISKGGKSLYSGDSNRYITGDALQIPFSESFAGQNYDDGHYWHSINEGERWNLDGNLVYDNDEGAAKFAPANMGENSLFYTSRIDLRGTQNPLLTFYYWHVKNSDMILQVQVSRENGEFETVRTFNFADDDDPAGWKKGAVLLSDFTDAEYVLIGWKATAGMIQTVTALDAIDLLDVASADLSVSLSAPEKAAEGQPVMMVAKVRNEGATDATDFKVRLTHENLGTVDEIHCESLPIGMEKEFEFNLPFHVSPGLSNGAYIVSTIWDADINFANDTDRKVVELRAGRLPKPTGLSAKKENSDVVLEWNAPELEGRITDDAEDYDAFLISDFGDWITIDRDRQITYKIIEPVINEETEQIGQVTLEYPNAGEEMAFMVFNPFLANSSLAEGMCHSGRQMFASFAAVKNQNNDWLISPELSGEAQTVTFFARSGGDEAWGEEELEVYCSDHLQAPESFTCILNTTKIPNGEWTEISVDLPEGTRHFAIRCVSKIVMTLFIDDISYTPTPCKANLTGYEIYRDDTLIDTTGAETLTYVDRDLQKDVTYSVRAVYDEGVSLPSKPVTVEKESAVDAIEDEGIVINVTQNHISVTLDMNSDIRLYTIDGRTAAQLTDANRAEFNISKGVYIIRIGNRSFKVMVR